MNTHPENQICPLPLYMYSCGCIGFEANEDGWHWVLFTCDGDLVIHKKRLGVDHTWRGLTPEEQERVLEGLSEQLLLGERFRELLQLLTPMIRGTEVKHE